MIKLRSFKHYIYYVTNHTKDCDSNIIFSNSIAHTNAAGANAWWMLTFPSPVFISSIKIYPRYPGGSVLNGITVQLDDIDTGTIQNNGGIREILDVDSYGSIVKIIGWSGKIQMAEVEIYGHIDSTEIIVYYVKLI